jgi:hypothetical protein
MDAPAARAVRCQQPAMKLFRSSHLVLLGVLALGRGEMGAVAVAPATSIEPEKEPDYLRARAPGIAWAVERFNWRMHEGDDVRWAQPGWDDQDWRRLDNMFETPAGRGIFWLRFRVRARNPADRVPTGAWISGLLAYDLYWDGELIVHNGIPGNRREDEIPGLLDLLPRFPEELTGPGEHVIAMRVSSYRAGPPGTKAGWVFFMNDPSVVQSWHMRNGILPAVAAGAMLILSLACGLLWWFAARRGALLFLGMLGLCAGTAEMLKAVRWFYAYPVTWLHPMGVAHEFLGDLLAWCVVGFAVLQFAVPRPRGILALVVPLLLFVHWLAPGDEEGLAQGVWEILAAYGITLGVSIWAARQGRPGAWPVIIGVTASALWILVNPWLFAWTGFFPRFLPTVTGMIVATAVQIRVERRKARQTELTAARLEVEVLKKSLQPHFLMNSLTALAQTVEENPIGAVRFINDLAEEFRTLAAISGQTRVPLARELALCRAHLRVMRARTDIDWQLVAEGIEGDAQVPPAMFLTLIENSFSHQRPCPGANAFRLRAERIAGTTRYTFFSPGTVTVDAVRPTGGTGLRYLRARLEESFPGIWSLAHGAVPDGWQTVVELRSPAMRRRPG